jgi:predicted ATPase/class 3 adenylate cyclase
VEGSDTSIFLFTDLEGSTRLWDREPSRMAEALSRHDELCRDVIAAHQGHLVKMMGDGMQAVFGEAARAIAAVVELQRQVATLALDCGLPLKMRCGLHAGTAHRRDGDYFGTSVNRAARIMSAAHGGQVLLSQAVADVLSKSFSHDVALAALGRVRLRDLSAPETLWQLIHPDLQREFPTLRSLDVTPNNLPQQLSSFIGRDTELRELEEALTKARLVTLTGAGGTGKTRLSLQVAAEALDRFPDGAWLIPLASLVDAERVPQAIATALGLREEPGRGLLETVVDHLKPLHVLLILDNAEHLLDACARCADALLRQCQRVTLLVSSRERLGMEGELTYRVPPLEVPDSEGADAIEHVASFGAVALFIERAQLHQPGFNLTPRNAGAICAVCRRLDGIPLALELAAARVRSMAVEEIERRLDRRFDLLKGGSRTASPRQQTLRSLIDWSFDLLEPAEQSLLARLAVFSGGWTLDAAERVCSDEVTVARDSVLDLTASLADKSLLVVDVADGATRYGMLETIRQYAQERLLQSGQSHAFRARHLAHFLSIAKQAAKELQGADQNCWFDRLELEHDNMRAALSWGSSGEGAAADALQLSANLAQFWRVRGYFAEGRAWLSQCLHAAPANVDPEVLSLIFNGLGILALRQGDYGAARASHEESLRLRRATGDPWSIAGSLSNLGNVAFEQGDVSRARALYEEGLSLYQQTKDRRRVAAAQINLANLASSQGEHAFAEKLLNESIAALRDLDHPMFTANALTNLGDVRLKQRDYSGAAAAFRESVALQRDTHDRELLPYSLEGLGDVALAESALHRAAVLWGAAERLRDETGSPLPPNLAVHRSAQVAAARAAAPDPAAFGHAWQEGRSMTIAQMAEYALS